MAKARTKRRSEHLFQGVGVSGGIAIGPAHVVTPGAAHVPRHAIARRAVSAERKRFAEAVDKARKQIQKLVQRSRALPAGAAEEVGFLLDASLAMLGRSRLVRGVDERIARDLVNAEAAVEDEIAAIAHGFAQMADEYFAARVNDVREVGARLVRNLTREPYQAFSDLPAGTILVAEELTPADTALMDPSRIAGFVASAGGIEGHTAIMARALSLPSVLGVPDLLAHVLHGDDVIVDGESGQVVINPTAATRQRFDTRRRALQRRMRQLARLRDLPAETRDGEIIQLQANLELPRELDTALAAGASGVGLLRSEFVFMNRSDLPSEDEQYLVLRTLVDGMAGRPITVRTLDVGGEKLWDSLGGMSQGPNPVLGLRAIRLSLRYPALLETQLAAILRAGAHGPLRILLPMISTVAEVTAARAAMVRVARRLRRRKVAIADPLPPLGVMIEVPSAALIADALAKTADFFAIGTNDLTQYTLAIDRTDDQVAYLYDPLHPAVLKLIALTVAAAARRGIPVSLCGEMAGDPRLAPLLLGLGVRELSMAPGSLLRVKARVRTVDMALARRKVTQALDAGDSAAVAKAIASLNSGPD